jgi:hypothetical protein
VAGVRLLYIEDEDVGSTKKLRTGRCKLGWGDASFEQKTSPAKMSIHPFEAGLGV